MPVSFEIADGVMALRMRGGYEPADIRAALHEGLALTEETPVRGLLFDVRASEALEHRPTQDVRDMARHLAANAKLFGGRLALVAVADYAYGLMRMGSILLEQAGVKTAVFRDEAAALRWLHE